MSGPSGFSVRGRIICLAGGEPLYAHVDRLRAYFGSLLAIPVVDPKGQGPDKDGCVEVLFKVVTPSGRECLGGSKALPTGTPVPEVAFGALGNGAQRLRDDAAKPGADPVLREIESVLKFPDPIQSPELWRLYRAGFMSAEEVAVCWGIRPVGSHGELNLRDIPAGAPATAGSGASRKCLCLPPLGWALLALLRLLLLGGAGWFAHQEFGEQSFLRNGHPPIGTGAKSFYYWQVLDPLRPDIYLENPYSEVPHVLARVDSTKPTRHVPVKLRRHLQRDGALVGEPIEHDCCVVANDTRFREDNGPPPPGVDYLWWIVPPIPGDVSIKDPTAKTPELVYLPGPLEVTVYLEGKFYATGKQPEPLADTRKIMVRIPGPPINGITPPREGWSWRIASPANREGLRIINGNTAKPSVEGPAVDRALPTEAVTGTLEGEFRVDGRRTKGPELRPFWVVRNVRTPALPPSPPRPPTPPTPPMPPVPPPPPKPPPPPSEERQGTPPPIYLQVRLKEPQQLNGVPLTSSKFEGRQSKEAGWFDYYDTVRPKLRGIQKEERVEFWKRLVIDHKAQPQDKDTIWIPFSPEDR